MSTKTVYHITGPNLTAATGSAESAARIVANHTKMCAHEAQALVERITSWDSDRKGADKSFTTVKVKDQTWMIEKKTIVRSPFKRLNQ